jgi:uncharacterized protein (DUF1015 family)
VRYAPDRVSGLADVTSPPYDVIFADNENQLMAADPHNVVRLILPRAVPGKPGEEYADAAVLMRTWLAQRILVPDPVPALYVYEQAVGDDAAAASEFGHGIVQRGLIGCLRLVPADAGIVLPHEDVSPGPVAGRLQLMEATQANLEPIFLLYDGGAPGRAGLWDRAVEPGAGPGADVAGGWSGGGWSGGGWSGGGWSGGGWSGGAASRIVARTAAGSPLVEAKTADGLRHRLWAITDADELAAIAADLAPRQALIADGHHRYAAYLKLAQRRRQAGDGAGAWDYGLALLVDSSRYPPRIGAIHRVIHGLEVGQAAKLAGTAFEVQALPGGAADVAAAEAALAEASTHGPAFVLAGAAGAYLISHPDPAQADAAMPAGTSPQWRALPAAILQELLISRVWQLTDDDTTVTVVHHDAAAAVRAAQGAEGTAVLCSPMTPAQVYAVAARGEKVPRKSTSFAPKPRTGLVLRTFAQS